MTLKFDRGRLVATLGVLKTLENMGLGQDILAGFLTRHLTGDWGEVDAHDWEENDFSVQNRLRILSAYTIPEGPKVWVITESDRSVTTFLLPEEY
jgi:hypothetical protein